MRAEYPDARTEELAARLDRSARSVYMRAYLLGLSKSAAYLASPAAGRTNGRQGVGSRFKPGHSSWNRGVPGSTGTHENCRATQFRAGRSATEARNYQPIGTERICKDGYIERKVTDDPALVPARRWVGVHRLLWEEHLGPIPRGFAVTFKNGNKRDIRIDNLALTPRGLLMRRNSYHTRYPELAPLIQLRGALNRKINNRTRAA